MCNKEMGEVREKRRIKSLMLPADLEMYSKKSRESGEGGGEHNEAVWGD